MPEADAAEQPFQRSATMPTIFWLRARNAVISSASRGWAAMRARSYTCWHSRVVVSSSAEEWLAADRISSVCAVQKNIRTLVLEKSVL